MGRFSWISRRLESPRLLKGKSVDQGFPRNEKGVPSSRRGFLLRFELKVSAKADDDERVLVRDDKIDVPGAAQNRPLALKASYSARPADLSIPSQPQEQDEDEQSCGSYSCTVSFWDALDPTEREALRSVASWRTFAAGAMLMREGDRADHVMIILGGRTKICIHENGEERILAERGLGQLVGERGALEVSVRSATVVALEMVWSLVVETKDFAAFITAHPGVLDTVQDQLYDRLTEGHISRRRASDKSTGRRSGPLGSLLPGGQRGSDLASEHARQHPEPLEGQNCTVFLTDVVAFGASTRNDYDRRLIREALFAMMRSALQELPDSRLEDRGDGFLTIVPPSISTARVLQRLLEVLPTELGRTNAIYRPSARFQLRLAINVGPVVSDAAGVSGEAIIVAARLVEAPKFKEAITDSAADLGLIASPFVYETVIRHSPDPNDVASYTQVPVEVKESNTVGWMKLIKIPVPPMLTTYPENPESFALKCKAGSAGLAAGPPGVNYA
jgi:CRP-like cAMP-binding protein